MRHVLPALGFAALLLAGPANAGPIFLTGHDPDFHAADHVVGTGGAKLLQVALDFVTGNTTNTTTEKFLWVQALITPPGGHRDPLISGLGHIGLTNGLHFDAVDATGLASVNFSNYTAIGVASSFGGLLTRAELDGLIARKDDIADFINAGGGLFASAECDNCGFDLLGEDPDLFGFVPLEGIVSVGASGPFAVTAAGAAAPFNLTNADVNDPTHNSFALASIPAALSILDTQPDGNAVILAGNVLFEDDEIVEEPGNDVPEPDSLLLFGVAAVLLSATRRASRRS